MKRDPHEGLAELGWALENLYGLVAWRVFRHAATMLDGEVTFSRVMALFHLYRRGPQTIAAQADAASLSHAAASRMIDGLFKAGIVDRREAPDDRRQKRVELTQAGKQRVEALRAATAAAYAQLLGPVPRHLRARLAAALEEIEPFLPPRPVTQVRAGGPSAGEDRKRSNGKAASPEASNPQIPNPKVSDPESSRKRNAAGEAANGRSSSRPVGVGRGAGAAPLAGGRRSSRAKHFPE